MVLPIPWGWPVPSEGIRLSSKGKHIGDVRASFWLPWCSLKGLGARGKVCRTGRGRREGSSGPAWGGHGQ